MKIVYYGHSCFALVLSLGQQLLFDPFITSNELAHVDIANLSPDYVLLSHGHEDHVADAATILLQSKAILIAAYEVVQYFERKGIQRLYPMNQGGAANFKDFSLKCTIAHHSSSMPDGSYGGQPMGFVLRSEDQTIYYAGDTALSYDMQLVGESFSLDLAILPIGDTFTMGVGDAIRAAQLLNCKQVMGVHYDTFETIRIDKAAAVSAFSQAGCKLLLPEIGEQLSLKK